jgi:molybdopterin converting factor small subunit
VSTETIKANLFEAWHSQHAVDCQLFPFEKCGYYNTQTLAVETAFRSSRLTYKLLLFASLRERVGSDFFEIESSEPLTVAQLLEAFYDAHPQLAKLRHVTRLAVNAEFAEADTPVPANAELALIPPVSGG